MPFGRRPPACAGQFYEAAPDRLRQQVLDLLEPNSDQMTATAVVCPHAGLMYSGRVAGSVYSRLDLPATAILVGPNHTGCGPPLSVYAEGEWEFPGGVVRIATDLAHALLRRHPMAVPDQLAHQYEHCLEVQLPFLSALRPDISIVPIVVGERGLESCLALGGALAAIVEEAGSDAPLLIASSDMTHCGPGFEQFPPGNLTADAFARRQDRLALDALLALDETRFYSTVELYDVTMCGYAPTAAVLAAARKLGAREARLVRYATSADVSGDVNRVVGYAGVTIR